MSEQPQPWVRPTKRPLVLGHRGARHAAEENTLAAFDLALQEGADGIELDVRLSADSVPFVMHDASLCRVTNGNEDRRVDQLSGAELDHVVLRGGHRIPRLSEVLEWAIRHEMLLNLDLKTEHARTDKLAEIVVEMLRQSPVTTAQQVVVSSFHPLLLTRFRALVPEIPLALLFERRHQSLACSPWAKSLNLFAVHPSADCLMNDPWPSWPEQAQVNTWTVNDPEQAKALAPRVNALISDCPGRLLQALESE